MKKWVERQRNLIDFTLATLLRRKEKNAALFFVYTLIIFLLASVMFFTQALKKEASILLESAPEMVLQRIVANRHDLMPTAYVEKIQKMKGVRWARGRLWGYYYDHVIGANYTLVVKEGFHRDSGKIIIGEGVSRTRLAFEGDLMEFRDYKGAILNFKVKKVLSPASERVSSDLVLISEEDFRRLFGLSRDYVTDATLQVDDPESLPEIAARIAKLLPDTKPILRKEILETYESIFSWRKGMMLIVLAGALLPMIIFAWDKASGMGAEEKKEIGILKAVGWEKSDVLAMKFWEGVGISLASFLIGVCLAYVHVFFTSSALFEPVLRGWAILYPDFKLTPFIDYYQVLLLLLLTVFPYTVATILPSLKAMAIDPDSVMRS